MCLEMVRRIKHHYLLNLESYVYQRVYFMNENNLRIFEKLLVNIKNYCYSTDVYMQPC